MNTFTKTKSYGHKEIIKIKLLKSTFSFTILFGLFTMCNNAMRAQSTTQITNPSPKQTELSGTLHLYLVTNYGEKMQEVDRYRKTGEGSMIAFILETDQKIDMTQYLDKEDLESLSGYAGSILQSEFMLVPDWEVFASFSYKDFAAKYAHKRVRVTGTFFYPDGGWQNVTPVRMDFHKVEVIE